MSEQIKIIDFMGHRKLAALLSLLLILGSIASLTVKGLSFGLDFTGGTLVEVNYSQPEPLSNVRATLEKAGYSGAVVVHFGSDTDMLVRLSRGFSDTLATEVVNTLQKDSEVTITLRRIEFVGPQVGEELKDESGLAMLLALVMVMFYVALRFQYKFSVGAVAGLAHDVIIILGMFSFFGWNFDLTVLAAVLAVIGYSLNDTIVVADRMRENFRKLRKADSIKVMNISLTQTFSRTLVTSLTTLFVLIALFIFGGELIHGFATALIIGVIVGTYSSHYVSTNVMLWMGLTKEDLIIPPKEGTEADGMP